MKVIGQSSKGTVKASKVLAMKARVQSSKDAVKSSKATVESSKAMKSYASGLKLAKDLHPFILWNMKFGELSCADMAK